MQDNLVLMNEDQKCPLCGKYGLISKINSNIVECKFCGARFRKGDEDSRIFR